MSTVVDFARDRSNDISNSKVAEDVSELVDTADILGIDLPCNSLSRARRAPQHSSMPSAVRSNASLVGLPGLSTKDQKFVNKHNVMFRRSMNWQQKHQAHGGNGYIENPLTSMLWKARTVRAMEEIRYSSCSDMTCASMGLSTKHRPDYFVGDHV